MKPPGKESVDRIAPRARPLLYSTRVYHFGTFVAVVALLVALVALVTNHIFGVFIYGYQENLKFHTVSLQVGLFGMNSHVKYSGKDNVYAPLDSLLELKDHFWTAAKFFCVLAILLIIVALVLHMLAWRSRKQRSQCFRYGELAVLVMATLSLVAGLSFAETEAERVHDHGDEALTKFLLKNGLVSEAEVRVQGNSTLSSADFDLLTKTSHSLYGLIAAAFMMLIPCLCTHFFLVRKWAYDQKIRQAIRKSEQQSVLPVDG